MVEVFPLVKDFKIKLPMTMETHKQQEMFLRWDILPPLPKECEIQLFYNCIKQKKSVSAPIPEIYLLQNHRNHVIPSEGFKQQLCGLPSFSSIHSEFMPQSSFDCI